MIRIGIVGAENSHSAAIARTCNVQKLIPAARVAAIWGETDAFAARSAEAGAIPTIVRRPTDMIGMIDAVVVDHRHAKCHLPAAEAFLKARLPMFIDKPFCYRLAEGRGFLARARRLGVPVTSYSSVPTQKSFAAFTKALAGAGAVRAVASFGPCDLESPYGGIFFYGIHQVDMILEAFGTDVSAVAVTAAPAKRGPGAGKAARGGPASPAAVATLFFRSGLTATMHCLTGGNTGFQLAAATDAGPVAARLVSDENPYLTSTRRFVKMFQTGKEPVAHSRILAPVAVLEALERAVRTGRPGAVAKTG